MRTHKVNDWEANEGANDIIGLSAIEAMQKRRARMQRLLTRADATLGLRYGDIEGLLALTAADEANRAGETGVATEVKKFLIVTADDFGVHRAVNEAVEQASCSGVLTAASLMVGAAATTDAVMRARRLPRLRVGLHLVLADGLATLAPEMIPSLTDARGYMNDRMFVNAVRIAANPRIRRQLEAEIRAQFTAFARTGLALDHVNVHKHFHLHPVLLTLIMQVGREFGMGAIRIPEEPLWAAFQAGPWSSGTAAVLLKPWLALMRRRVRAAGLASNDAVFGMAASGRMAEDVLLGILTRLTAGVTEIYLHPATLSGSTIAATMRGYRHEEELAALLSPRVREAIAACGARCGGYADIPCSSPISVA